MSTKQNNQKVNTKQEKPKREKRWEQAVRLAKEGKTYWQIAKEMGISQKSVWLHLVSHGYSLSQLKPKTHKHSPKTE
jgi:DNA-binding NarL/FixJ family response regulator